MASSMIENIACEGKKSLMRREDARRISLTRLGQPSEEQGTFKTKEEFFHLDSTPVTGKSVVHPDNAMTWNHQRKWICRVHSSHTLGSSRHSHSPRQFPVTYRRTVGNFQELRPYRFLKIGPDHMERNTERRQSSREVLLQFRNGCPVSQL